MSLANLVEEVRKMFRLWKCREYVIIFLRYSRRVMGRDIATFPLWDEQHPSGELSALLSSFTNGSRGEKIGRT